MTTYYAVAAGNFNASSTWSLASGGAGGAGVPGTGDVAKLDANTPGTVTISAAQTIGSLDCTGSAHTLQHNGFTLTIDTGDVTFVPGMTYSVASSSSLLSFTASTGTQNLTSAGQALGGITKTNAGTLAFQDAITVAASGNGGITLTSGTLTDNGYTVTAAFFSSSNTNARTFNHDGAWTLNCAPNATAPRFWNTTTTTNLTYNAGGSSSVTYAPANISGGLAGFAPGGLTFNNFNFNSLGYGKVVIDLQSNLATFATCTFTGPLVFLGLSGNNCTLIATQFVFATTAGLVALVPRGSYGHSFTLSQASGTITMDKVALCGITVSGGVAAPTATNSYDLGGNSGVTINGPSAGGGILAHAGLNGGFAA